MRVLQRRAAVGVRFEPCTPGPGVRVTAVIPNSGAHHGGVQVGDVLLGADQLTFTNEQVFRQWAAGLRAWDHCTLWIERGGARAHGFKITVYERAKEQTDGARHDYVQASVEGDALLRVIVSYLEARRDAPIAKVLVLPGYRRDSWDWPNAVDYPLRRWVDDLVAAGLCVVRVERRGVGDSEGDGASQGFDEERADLLSAAVQHASYPVSTAPWIVYGYSLGGLHAPMIANAIDARAVAVWGSGIDTWTEYLDALLRRRMHIERADEATIERSIRAQQALYATVHIRGETVAQAIARYPALTEFTQRFGLDPEHNSIDGRPARFWREVYRCPTAEALATLRAPLLALWGECDWLTTREEHQRIASVSPGATFMAVPRTDHAYAEHDSAVASFRGPPGPYSPRAAQALIAWARTIVRRT